MVKKSKMAGFDAVKFQKRDVKDLLNFNYKIEIALKDSSINKKAPLSECLFYIIINRLYINRL
jgi:sialic acid synthase SpsE